MKRIKSHISRPSACYALSEAQLRDLLYYVAIDDMHANESWLHITRERLNERVDMLMRLYEANKIPQ